MLSEPDDVWGRAGRRDTAKQRDELGRARRHRATNIQGHYT